MAFPENMTLVLCHNPGCKAQYFPAYVHVEEGWEHDPAVVCPYCGQNLKESAAKVKDQPPL